MAVRPQGVLAGGRPGRVDHARLGHQAVRALRHPARVHVRLAAGHLGQRPAEVHGARLAGRPGPATGTGPLSAKSTLQTPGPYRNRRSAAWCGPDSRSPASAISWRGVTSSSTARAGGSSSRERTQRPVSTSPPSDGQLGEQRLGEPGAAALDHRPAHRVRRHRQQQPERTGHRGAQRQHRVRGHPGEQALGFLGAEPPGQHRGGRQAVQAEAGHGQRMPGHGPDRGEDLRQGQPRVAAPAGRAAAGRRPRRGPGCPRSPRPSPRPPRPARRPAGGRTRPWGCSSVTPRAARSMLVKNGEDAASGWTAEHTSCRKPGRVSSAVRQPPPGVSAPSMTWTLSPARASVMRRGQAVGAGADHDRVGGWRRAHRSSIPPSAPTMTSGSPAGR